MKGKKNQVRHCRNLFLSVADHPRHPADGNGGSIGLGGPAGSHRLEPHGPHQVFTLIGSRCQGTVCNVVIACSFSESQVLKLVDIFLYYYRTRLGRIVTHKTELLNHL